MVILNNFLINFNHFYSFFNHKKILYFSTPVFLISISLMNFRKISIYKAEYYNNLKIIYLTIV